MRIAYLTTDQVNEEVARRLAATCGVTLEPVAPREAPPDGQFEAVLYDWDYWPADRRQELLAEFPSGPLHHPLALHSYQLEEGQAETLRRLGVGVFPRLEPGVFRFLRRAARRARRRRGLGTGS